MSLPDYFFWGEMKMHLKENPTRTSIDLMQTAITWTEKEEAQMAAPSRSHTRAAAAAEGLCPSLTLEALHRAIQDLAA